MLKKSLTIIFALAALLVLIIQPAAAATTTVEDVLYQATFSNDPGWTTNSAKSYFWVPDKGVYSYSIEPGNAGKAYVEVPNYEGGSFTLDYDVTPTSTEKDTAFRLGFSSQEMDRTKGTIALSEFTNGKYGYLMWIRAVTTSNRLVEVSSHQNSYGEQTGAPTINWVDNHTYHVTLEYDDEELTLTMRVIDKTAIANLWGYYLKLKDPLRGGMKYIVIGTIGDYSTPGHYARGYLDNVRFSVPKTVTTTDTPVSTLTQVGTTRTTARTTAPPTIAEETTPASPLSLAVPIAAGCIALFVVMYGSKRFNR